MTTPAKALANVIHRHREEISRQWATLLCEQHDEPSSDPLDELYTITARGCSVIITSLTTDAYSSLETYLTDICHLCTPFKMDTAGALQLILLGKEAIMPVIQRTYRHDPAPAWELMASLDACVRWMVCRVAEITESEMNQRLRQQQELTDMMLRVVRAVTGALELDDALHHIRKEIEVVVPGSWGLFYLVGQQRFLVPSEELSFHPYPVDDFIRIVTETRKPLVSFDAENDTRILEEMVLRGGFKSVLGLPMLLNEQVLAVVIVVTPFYHAFTSREIALIQGMADMAALSIRNVQLFRKAEQVAILKERIRLSREIHDELAQALGVIQLKLSMLVDLLPEGLQTCEAGHNLRQIQEILSATYADLRREIFNLRAMDSPCEGFLDTLEDYLHEFRLQYGMAIRLEAQEVRDPLLTGPAKVQAIRIIQEALTNVKKHAGTNTAAIHIDRKGGQIRICVEDEGQGFDPAIVSGARDGPRFGLQVMRERAESIGGTLTLESGAGEGTKVILLAPYRPNQDEGDDA